MIKLESLPKISKVRKKRLGQGRGSGKGKTSGRGTKGQKSREKMSTAFSALPASLVRRLPLFRGKYRNKPKTSKPIAVNIKYLNLLPPNSLVDIDLLSRFHIVDGQEANLYGVKILSEGEIDRSLTVKLPCSKKAAQKIVKAGGKVENQKNK